MSQVETVALWAGLLSSIAGIVLSVVATLFAIWVNKGATEVNNQMIRSLQKIESSVDRVSTDTRELISAGWNKMLGSVGQQSETGPVDSDLPDKISSGIASEVRSELMENGQQDPAQQIDRLEKALQDLQRTVAAQIRHQVINNKGPESIEALTQTISELPVEAKALLAILAKAGHLNRKQYRSATANPILRFPLAALRDSGLLVPLQGMDDDAEKVPVYWLPPGIGRRARVAVRLVGDVPREVLENITAILKTIGYEASS